MIETDRKVENVLMFQARIWFAVFVSSAALLHARAGSAAEMRRSEKVPLDLFTSKSCNQSGVNYAYYEGNWGKLPDFDKVKPVKQGTVRHIGLSPRKRDQHFALRFTGYLKVRSAGLFELFVESDDRSRLYVDSKIVVDEGKTRGEIRLAEGVHTVTLNYVQGTGDRRLNVTCQMPLAWDVKEAAIRVPVRVSLEPASARMPPHVYLAELNPVKTEGLTFDRKTKNAVLRDVRGKEDKEKIIARLKERCRKNNQEYKPEFYRLHGNPIMRVRGSATFNLKPEYKWLSFLSHGHAEVHIDGKRAPEVRGRQDGINPGDHRFPTYKREGAAIVRVPPGGNDHG